MIVSSMSSRELIIEILKDYSSVLNKSVHLIKQVRREAIKSRNKKYIKTFEYRSLQKNSWLILIDYNNAIPLVFPAVYYLNEGKLNAVVINRNKSIRSVIAHYSSHFLERFNERFIKEPGLPKLEILKRFLPQNTVATFDGFADKFGENHGRMIAAFKDGYGLGYYELYHDSEIVFLKTYISPDMLFERQKVGLGPITEAFKEHWDEFLKIKPDYNGQI